LLDNFLPGFLMRYKNIDRKLLTYLWILWEAAYLPTRNPKILAERKKGNMVSAISIEQLEVSLDMQESLMKLVDTLELEECYPIVGRIGRMEGKGLNLATFFGDVHV